MSAHPKIEAAIKERFVELIISIGDDGCFTVELETGTNYASDIEDGKTIVEALNNLESKLP